MGVARGVHQWGTLSSFAVPRANSASARGLERRCPGGSLKVALFARLQDLVRREGGKQMHDPSNGPRPAGLMAGAEARPVVAVKILIKEQAIAPVRIVLELASLPMHR